jgi:hypothetical protein
LPPGRSSGYLFHVEERPQSACAKYELPAKNLENLYNILSGIQAALHQGNTKAAQELAIAGQQQLREVVICFD